MKNLGMKIALNLALIALAIFVVVVKDVRLGKDLRGGVSLIYRVNMTEEEGDPRSRLAEVIRTLKERVNPTGVFDISMEPLGRDRIEVVMPLPGAEVQALQQEARRAMDALLSQAEIDAGTLDDSLRRGTAPAEVGGDTASPRGQLVAQLQSAFDQEKSARAALSALAPEADAADRRRAEFEVARTSLEVERLTGEVLAMSLPEARVKRVLGLPTTPQKKRDAEGKTVLDEKGNPVMVPSLREDAVAQLRSDFPHLSSAIDAAIATNDAYIAQRKGLDDPEDLMRLMQGAGVLEFRIAVENAAPEGVDVNALRKAITELGPENASGPTSAWFPINDLEQWADKPSDMARLEADPRSYFGAMNYVVEPYQGGMYMLLYTTSTKAMTHTGDAEWSLTGAGPTIDDLGRPSVAFQLDPAGAQLMGRLTGAHRGEKMAIVLDGEVFSAPNINSQITSNGQIIGRFTALEIQYLVKVLSAGSLSASLSDAPLSISVLGPTVGADNLKRGTRSFIVAIAAVGGFMFLYYFFAGLIANLALAINGLLIFFVSMLIDVTFTLPGFAGLVLTIGMAVDSNVLIFERIREEIQKGERDLRAAIRAGFNRALSTILDSNITNLLTCVVLFYTATTEVKGFAATVTIGIICTLFAALIATKVLLFVYVDWFKGKKLTMLAMAVPAIGRALEPKIDWIGKRNLFTIFSIAAVGGSLALAWSRGPDLFDTEFRGGLSMVMVTAPIDADGNGEPDRDASGAISRRMLAQSGAGGVEERIHAIGSSTPDPTGAPDDAERSRRTILRELVNAKVYTVGATGEEGGRLTAAQFQVKVSAPIGLDDDALLTRTIVRAMVEEFGSDLDVTPPLTFKGSALAGQSAGASASVRAITKPALGDNIGRPALSQRVPSFLGGAAIVLENVNPPVTPAEVQKRVDRMRNQPDFHRYSARKTQVIGVTPADPAHPQKGYTELIVLVNDPFRSAMKIAPDQWFNEVAATEWNLVSQALVKPADLDQVSSFSSAVAETLKASALVAVILSLLGILVYVWVRFGSLRYSIAAVLCLFHDVSIAIGFIALSTIVADFGWAKALLIEPFRIDLAVVAAMLTIIGYSLNDTIVIMDRIRENRGKFTLPSREMVNDSINQTLSRTVLTAGTTLIAIIVMYVMGGSGIRAFNFAMLIGVFVGTYSTVGIAAPMVYSRTFERLGGRPKAPSASSELAIAPASAGESQD